MVEGEVFCYVESKISDCLNLLNVGAIGSLVTTFTQYLIEAYSLEFLGVEFHIICFSPSVNLVELVLKAFLTFTSLNPAPKFGVIGER